ncbi:MAG: hypothetical protein OEZ10_00560 [Gammaproteobacteria bacterium]|nr:hypothetical protein [Gammaproteobacteria bacterium]
MLSHIVNLVNTYEGTYGKKPNLVYMNETHYSYLREEMPGVWDHNDVVSMLGIEIALDDAIIRPKVAMVANSEAPILAS